MKYFTKMAQLNKEARVDVSTFVTTKRQKNLGFVTKKDGISSAVVHSRPGLKKDPKKYKTLMGESVIKLDREKYDEYKKLDPSKRHKYLANEIRSKGGVDSRVVYKSRTPLLFGKKKFNKAAKKPINSYFVMPSDGPVSVSELNQAGVNRFDGSLGNRPLANYRKYRDNPKINYMLRGDFSV